MRLYEFVFLTKLLCISPIHIVTLVIDQYQGTETQYTGLNVPRVPLCRTSFLDAIIGGQQVYNTSLIHLQ